MKPLTFLIAALLGSLAHAQDWPGFRGPNGSAVARGGALPTRFGPDQNARWRTPVPYGSSSPVLTENAVVLTAADEQHLIVLALDRATGAELWTRTIERTSEQEVYSASDSASPTPVTDGTNVYAFFPEMGLVSFDAAGEERWRLPLGPFVSFYGMSSSPILVGDLLVLLCDQQVDSFILGVDANTGEQRWRAERAGIIECWTTPLAYPSEDPREVIVFGSYFVTSHSIETGEELWRMPGFGYTPVCSPTLDGDVLYVSVPDHGEAGLPDWATVSAGDANGDSRLERSETQGGLADHFGWVDTDKDDFVTEQEWNTAYDGMNSKDFGLAAIDLSAEGGPVELWRYKRALPSIASPLLYEGVLYLTRDGGLVTRLDAASGDVVSRERLPDGMGECWPSPIAGDGKIYVVNNSGKVAVLAGGEEWKVLETNDLGEECRATPAIGADALYVRTIDSLWSFGSAAAAD